MRWMLLAAAAVVALVAVRARRGAEVWHTAVDNPEGP